MMHGLAMCAVCLLVFAPWIASAFELGAIETRSALHEPLDARIPLRGVRNGDLEGLKISLGSPAQFELAGVVRLEHLDRLEFTVVDRSGGAGFIHVRTDEPIIEPSLTFLVDVDWPRGRAVRGYELRLASAAAGAVGARRNRPAAAPAAAPETGASSSTPASPPASSGADYGPVRASETLWSIATRFRPDDSVSVQRMMLAILETNPEAFVIPNVNALSAGAILRIPTREEIGPDDMKTALAEVRRQHSAWTRHRGRSPAAAAPSAPAPSPRPTGRKPDTPKDVAGREEDAGIEELRKELARARREADAGRREGSELRRRLTEAEGRIEELRKKLVRARGEAGAGRREGSELQRRLAEAEGRIEELRKELARARGDAGAGRREDSELRRRLAEAEGRIEELRKELVRARGEADAGRREGSELRRRLAEAEGRIRAREEADAGRRENSEQLQRRLAEAEDRIEELNRFVDRKNEEIAALRARVETEPADGVSRPEPADEASEPVAPPPAEDSKPDEASVETEPKSLPFGLGALPVNPVYLVGGAGLLLILLGVVALLRRRRSSAGEDDALDSADPAPRGEEGLLRERDAPSVRRRPGPMHPRDEEELLHERDAPSVRRRPGPMHPRDEEELLHERDAPSVRRRPGSMYPRDEGGLLHERDAPSVRRRPGSMYPRDEEELLHGRDAPSARRRPGSMNLSDGDGLLEELEAVAAELADGTGERPGRRSRAGRSGLGGLGEERVERRVEELWRDGRAAGLAKTAADGDTGAGTFDIHALTVDDSESSMAGGRVSRGSESGTAGSMQEGADSRPDAAAGGSVGLEPGSDDGSGGPRAASHVPRGEPADDGGTGAPSFDHIGEDEVQTKIDLAQVYMEMGDTERARGFLEAVLIQGDPVQRGTARNMLSKLA